MFVLCFDLFVVYDCVLFVNVVFVCMFVFIEINLCGNEIVMVILKVISFMVFVG